MAQTPEIKEGEAKPDISERPEAPDVSSIQKEGIAATSLPHEIETDGLGSQGQATIAGPAAQSGAVYVPLSQASLVSKAKGKIVSASTWLAAFWIRMIKKAIILGKRIIYKG